MGIDADIAFSGAAHQAHLLRGGTITAPALLELYLDRIRRLDPQLRAYRVVLVDTARADAAAAQERLQAGERLPLLGVPIAIKDDVDVAGEVTTMGTSAHGPAKTQDAEVVSRLRAAGAVIIGKTNVPELCIWPFTCATGCRLRRTTAPGTASASTALLRAPSRTRRCSSTLRRILLTASSQPLHARPAGYELR